MQKSQLVALSLKWGDWLVAGAIMVVALAFTFTAYSYSIGSIARIGPGMMPFLIGISLFFATGFVIFRPSQEELDTVRVPVFRMLALLGSIVVWALTIDRFGLVPATVLLMILATAAYKPIRWRSTAIVIAVTTVSCVLLFVYGFKLPFDIVSF